MQDSIYHMSLKSIFISEFCTKRQYFSLRKRDVFMDIKAQCNEVICIFNPLVEYRF